MPKTYSYRNCHMGKGQIQMVNGQIQWKGQIHIVLEPLT